MKSIRLAKAAIFFMIYFYRAGGGHGPLGLPGSATAKSLLISFFIFIFRCNVISSPFLIINFIHLFTLISISHNLSYFSLKKITQHFFV